MQTIEITIRTKRRHFDGVTRDKRGDGIIRIDGEACLALEQVISQMEGETNTKDVASALIKAAVEHAIIKEEEE